MLCFSCDSSGGGSSGRCGGRWRVRRRAQFLLQGRQQHWRLLEQLSCRFPPTQAINLMSPKPTALTTATVLPPSLPPPEQLFESHVAPWQPMINTFEVRWRINGMTDLHSFKNRRVEVHRFCKIFSGMISFTMRTWVSVCGTAQWKISWPCKWHRSCWVYLYLSFLRFEKAS